MSLIRNNSLVLWPSGRNLGALSIQIWLYWPLASQYDIIYLGTFVLGVARNSSPAEWLRLGAVVD
jgi:hypothetical protein